MLAARTSRASPAARALVRPLPPAATGGFRAVVPPGLSGASVATPEAFRLVVASWPWRGGTAQPAEIGATLTTAGAAGSKFRLGLWLADPGGGEYAATLAYVTPELPADATVAVPVWDAGIAGLAATAEGRRMWAGLATNSATAAFSGGAATGDVLLGILDNGRPAGALRGPVQATLSDCFPTALPNLAGFARFGTGPYIALRF